MAAAINGPFKILTGPGGGTAPFYMIRFDKRGVCTSPASLADLLRACGSATDVFLFSHGWNNDWASATGHYQRFIDQFNRQYAAHWASPTRPYRPVLVGVHWPSTALVSASEAGPAIAGGGDGENEEGNAQGNEPEIPQGVLSGEVDLLAESLDPAAAARLYALLERPQLAGEEALELARLLVPALTGVEDEAGESEALLAPDPEELVRLWSSMPADDDPQEPTERGGFVDGPPETPMGNPTDNASESPAQATSDPQAAGWLDNLNPRNVIRSATVLLMKDRAGRVGGAGVRDMLHGILAASPDSRVHLIGHSYGAKVVLSALANGSPPARPVESVLLLQPATSAKCFADPAGGERAGGYRPALDRSRQPIMTTFSSHDVPLTTLFHFAARRASDKREAVIAGAPSEFAALGGFGPQDVASLTVVDTLDAPQRYELPATRLLALRSDRVISGHGDVENPATAWALLCQVME